MSFECLYKNNDKCELRKKECIPGEKGCILHKSGYRIMDLPQAEGERKRPGKN
ncbi:MAG: hypothetical protein HPY53_10300 [Brevinematales bacterium]|nr:hypothetical protein [Brevinematales bacterium]